MRSFHRFRPATIRPLLAGGIAVLLALTASCQFKAPVFPAWEVLVRVPFLIDDFVIGERLVDSTNFVVKPISEDENQILFLNIPGELQLEEVLSSDFVISPSENFRSISLGSIEFNDLPPLEVFFPIGDIIDLSGLVGQSVDVPDQTVQTPQRQVEAEEFQSIYFVDGMVELTITNRLPFAIGPNGISGGLRVDVFSDDNADTPFTTLEFEETIESGGSSTEFASISERWLVSPLSTEMLVPLVGATIDVSQEMLDTSAVDVEVRLLDVAAGEATARLEEQTVSDTAGLAFDSPMRVRSALVDSGLITVQLTNQMPVAATGTVSMPQIIDENDQSWSAEIVLPAGGVWTHEISLTGLRIENRTTPGSFVDSLEIVVEAESESTDDFVTITSSDRFDISVISEEISILWFDGFIEAYAFELTPILQENVADYEGFEGNLEVADAFMELNITNELFIEDFTMDLVITGFHVRENGTISDSASVHIRNIVFEGGDPQIPAETHVEVDTGLVALINLLPNALRFAGSIRVAGEAIVNRGDRITSNYLIETPISIQITDSARFRATEDTIAAEEINEEVSQSADDHLLSGDLAVTVTNRTPLGGRIRIIISTDLADTNLYEIDAADDTSLFIADSIEIQPGETNPLTGFVSQPWVSDVTLDLNQREIGLFNNPPIRVGVEWLIPDTEGFVTLRYSDFMEVVGQLDIRVLVEDPDE